MLCKITLADQRSRVSNTDMQRKEKDNFLNQNGWPCKRYMKKYVTTRMHLKETI